MRGKKKETKDVRFEMELLFSECMDHIIILSVLVAVVVVVESFQGPPSHRKREEDKQGMK